MNKFEQNQSVDKKQLSVKHLTNAPRLGEIKLEDEKFFAYEKQKAHN